MNKLKHAAKARLAHAVPDYEGGQHVEVPAGTLQLSSAMRRELRRWETALLDWATNPTTSVTWEASREALQGPMALWLRGRVLTWETLGMRLTSSQKPEALTLTAQNEHFTTHATRT